MLTADVSDPPGSSEHICPVDFPLDILYEDEDLLVLNKPAGIAIHSAALTEETVTVAGSVVHYLGQDSFHCVNRLDRGTTGAMVVAKIGVHARAVHGTAALGRFLPVSTAGSVWGSRSGPQGRSRSPSARPVVRPAAENRPGRPALPHDI